eukprot:2076165-Lingulodinium_polyedra.AAC.1
MRYVVAQHYLDTAKAKLQQLERCNHMILQVALDETELPVRLEVANELSHVMVLGARLCRRRG